jgi:hypothetical protein
MHDFRQIFFVYFFPILPNNREILSIQRKLEFVDRQRSGSYQTINTVLWGIPALVSNAGSTCLGARGMLWKCVACDIALHLSFILSTATFSGVTPPSSSAIVSGTSGSKLFIEQVSLFISVWMSVAACDTWAISSHCGLRVTAQSVGFGWLDMGRTQDDLIPTETEMFSPPARPGQLPERTEQPVNEFFKSYNEPPQKLMLQKPSRVFISNYTLFDRKRSSSSDIYKSAKNIYTVKYKFW